MTSKDSILDIPEACAERDYTDSSGIVMLLYGAGRQRASLLGDSPEDDVADPAGGMPHAYADTASQLDRLVTRLAELGWAY